MADVHNKETRSYNMSRIKGKDTKCELIVRKFLYANGFRYRLNYKKLPGKPDIVLPKYKTVIFVHGCFWHGHEGCRYFVMPKTRTEWWSQKIEHNKIRDAETKAKLTEENWRVIEIFECELKRQQKDNTLGNLLNILTEYGKGNTLDSGSSTHL